ncbi:transcription elongation factor SPT6 homolog [Salvia hispanica]|uniref:transcription elongation factor SPT6 homolog n=1 Tax=Salvia hispanica TaxID=49212 RepID=UPI002008FFC3|nr:transcription elongation factor SPT6 homolog [Salvia hispanica]
MAGKNVISDDEDEIGVEEEERDEVPYGDRGGDRNDDDEEDDEEVRDEYEKDGFIVDDIEEGEDEEEDQVDSDEEQKKRKRKKRDQFMLDEDDYELLQESNISVNRPKLESKKFKRLKKARQDAQEDPSRFSDEEEFNGSGNARRTGEEKLKHSFVGDDYGQPLEDIAEEDGQLEEEEDADIGEEDEMADFIVDEEDVDEHGAPVRRKKPKKSRQRPGISSSALQEAHEIFGDVEDLLRLRKIDVRDSFGETSERSLEDQFDPSVLSEKYMTEKDDQIREIDIPERIQISEGSTGHPPTDEFSVKMETEWICNQLISGVLPFFNRSGIHDEMKRHIARFLELIHVQKLDVPFIAMYRKEEILSLLKDPTEPEAGIENDINQKPALKWHQVLWAIQDLDQKWLLLLKRKIALQSYYTKRFEEEKRRVYDETRLRLNEHLFQSITKSLEAVDSEREVDDVDSKFNLHFPTGEAVLDEGQFKRPKRKSHYSSCSKAGLWEVASKFGYSSEQFGLQISLEKMRMDELEDVKETPAEMASNFTCTMFETPQAVLKGARHMAAVEISFEPCVRKHVRSIFMDNAVVSASPTPDGNTAIDSFHQFYGIKWLRDKPLNRFEDAQWLLIQKAEEEKLLQVSIKLPEVVLDKLISDSNDYYLSDGVSKSAQLWNEQRKLILNDALNNYLLSSMEKEARSLLTSRAKSWLLSDYGRLLWDKVSVAPYQRKENDVSSDEETAPRVMACCWGPGKPATTFVMLDSSGEVLDVLHAGSISIHGQSGNEQQRKRNDQQRVRKFMMDHQPHIVVLGATNLSCTRLKDRIYEIMFKMVEDNPRDVGYEMDNLNVVFCDESLPHLYENSRISVDQLPSQEGIIRRAVGLGRHLQNPLAMVATLCGPGKEILSWKLNPLDNFLTPDEKYGMVEQVMVDVTNQVGLDINLAASHEWLFAPLQFISGLGPRKAASLQRSLVRAGAIFTRKDLLQSHGLGKKVFINAVGFLRVRRSGLTSSSSQFIDLLDDTRVHPESYILAQDLAKDIYLEDGNDDANDDDDVLEMAIEHVREKPHLLRAVDVHEYAVQKNHLNKKETLNDIRLELMEGFQDRRSPFAEPCQDELFHMMTGETEETLSEGRIVQATVRNVQAQRASCVLESGLTGILSKEDYMDDWRNIHDLSNKLRDGDILTCRIKSIQKNRYQVVLTCRGSDMRSNRYQSHRMTDPYYHEERSTLQTVQEKARKEKELAKKCFKPRMIVHPHFQNITPDAAIKFLADKDPGESVIRPSSRGLSILTLTMKVYDGVYANTLIEEGGKEHGDITSLLRIGKTLKIRKDTFEDLDEVMDRYVDPLVAHLKSMLNHRKFRTGTRSEIEELLRIEKAEDPSKSVYCFGISHEHPGLFILTYIVHDSNPQHEFIGLYPQGFSLCNRMCKDIDRLSNYFKKLITGARDPAQSLPSVAAMVPMRSPAMV